MIKKRQTNAILTVRIDVSFILSIHNPMFVSKRKPFWPLSCRNHAIKSNHCSLSIRLFGAGGIGGGLGGGEGEGKGEKSLTQVL